MGENVIDKWLSSDKTLCQKSDNLSLAKGQIEKADIIILAAFWRKWAAESLSDTIQNLDLATNQRIFVIGRRSFRSVSESISKSLNNSELNEFRIKVDTNQIEINNIMKNSLDEKSFINVHRLICGEGSTCPAFTNTQKLISFDGGHLSQAGAKFIGQELFHKSQLRQLIQNY